MLDINLLGKNIRALRKEKGLTQAEFAGDLNVSFQAVSGWERGVTPPDISNLLRISDYFGITLDDLFRKAYTAKLYLGIDGGGTKTEFAITDENGTVLKVCRTKGCNPNDIGISGTIELISSKIKELMSEFPSVSYVFCGIAGLLSGNNKELLAASLKKTFPSLSFSLNTDSANLFGMDSSADMVIISGTGSVVFVKKKGEFIRLGGWGYLLDESGSAYDIGRDALRQALYEEDSMLPASVMSTILKKKLGREKIWDSISEIYREGKPFIASLSGAVFEAFEKGDENAASIIEKSARRLAELLNTGIEKYDASPLAIAGGGIFEHYPDIIIPMINKYTSVKLISVDLPPVYGACRASVSLDKGSVCDEFYNNFKMSYGGEK